MPSSIDKGGGCATAQNCSFSAVFCFSGTLWTHRIGSTWLKPWFPLATGEWVPYSSQHLPGYGSASEIVTAAFQAVGLNVRYDFYPWKRAEASVAAGSVFAAFPYFLLPERAERGDLFLHSQPLFLSVYGILYSTARTDASHLVPYRQPRDLLGKRIGILAGTPLVAFPLKEAGVIYEETPLIDFSVRKLHVGRIDYVIDDRAVLTNKIQELFQAVNRLLPFSPLISAKNEPCICWSPKNILTANACCRFLTKECRSSAPMVRLRLFIRDMICRCKCLPHVEAIRLSRSRIIIAI